MSNDIEMAGVADAVSGPCGGGFAELWKVAYPLIITNATHTVMQFVDRKFLAMSSTRDVAAALPGGLLAFTMFTFFMVTTGFTAAIVSQNHGRKNLAACSRVPWTGFYFALASGVFCSLFLTWPGCMLIVAGGHPPDLIASELSYFRMIMPSGGFIFISTAFCAFFSGRGRTWTVALVHFLASALNILLDYMLIFGKFGAPAMGIAGAGLATTLSCVAGAGMAFAFFILQNQSRFPTRSGWRYRHDDMLRLVSFGAPAGMQVLFSVGAFAVIVFQIGRIGQMELAATTIALSINMLTFMPLMGISEATGIIVGKHIGAGRRDTASGTAMLAWKVSSLYMVAIGLVYVIFPDILLEFFSPGDGSGTADFAGVLETGRIILIFAAFHNFFNAARFVFMGALRGAGDTKVPMWIIIGCSWTMLAPGGYILVNVLGMGIFAVWVFLTSYGALLGFLIWLRFKSGAWRSIEMLEPVPAAAKPVVMEALDYESESPHV